MEKWLPVRRWKGWYEVSDAGRVRSLPRFSIAGGSRAFYQGKLLKQGTLKSGYKTVSLTRPSKKEYKYVHQLVAEAFIGRCPKNKEVRHKDGTRDGNRLKNLTYGTRRENALDRREHGTMPTGEHSRGEKNGLSKLNKRAVRYIRARPKVLLRVLADKFDVTIGAVWCVRARKTWRHL